MSDVKTMGSIADKLLSYVNTALVHDTNYQIAVSMLKHYDKLGKMSLSEMAELCFVSKSAITRYCHFLGFNDFNEFREALSQKFDMGEDYTKKFQKQINENSENAIKCYCEDIHSNIEKALGVQNQEKIPEIIKNLHGARRIVFLSHHFLCDIGHYFQSKMMMMGKYVEQFVDYDMQLESVYTLGKEDLVIVCSIGGSYPARYNSIWNAMKRSGCKQLIVTQNDGSPYWNNADYILKCGEFNRNDVGKYAALAIMDLLVISYYSNVYIKNPRNKDEVS